MLKGASQILDANGLPYTSTNPLPALLTGRDASNNLRTVQVDSNGRVQTETSAAGSVTPGAVGTKSMLIGGQFNTSLPSLTNGQQCALQFDQYGRLITASSTISPLPAASFKSQQAINSGVTYYSSYTAAQRLAIKQFYAGGKGVGKQTLYTYAPSTTQYLSGGNFESTSDVSLWAWTSVAGAGSIAFSTAQKNTGSGSVALIFTNSSGNSAQGITQNYSPTSPLNVSGWRYITAQFYNVLSTGGSYTRTISVILTDSAANTRKYDVSGVSTAAPFSTSGWVKITGEIENPTSSTGTSFDVTSVVSVELRMNDSANKAGTVYWDTVQFEGAKTLVFPIYHLGNLSFNLSLDPVLVLEIGDQILLEQKNDDAVRREYFALVGGVSL